MKSKHTTHYACDEQLKKYGGKTLGCCCTGHECKEPKERVEEPKESQGEKCTRTPKCSDCNDWKELGGYPIVCKECGWHQQQDAIVCCNPDCDAGVGDVRGKYIKVSPEVEAEIRKGAVWHEKEPDFIVNIPKNTKELKRVDIMQDGKLWGSVEKEPEKCKECSGVKSWMFECQACKPNQKEPRLKPHYGNHEETYCGNCRLCDETNIVQEPEKCEHKTYNKVGLPDRYCADCGHIEPKPEPEGWEPEEGRKGYKFGLRLAKTLLEKGTKEETLEDLQALLDEFNEK